MILKAKFQISKSKVIEKYNNLKELTDIVAYSVKSNTYITSILEEKTDSKFLIHHINEMKFVRDYSKVIFMLHSPDLYELNLIFEKNITDFIIDNKNDLNFFLEYIAKNNKKVNVFLRMRLKEYTVQTGRYFVFGMYSKDINDLIPKLKINKNINKIGIHFHRKTQNLSEWSLIRELNDSISKETWESIDYLDIGGGIPVSYKNIASSTIDQIYLRIRELRDFLNLKNIKMIIEPGRAIAAPSARLITTIKNIVQNNIFIDASVFNCSMDTIVSGIKLLVENENVNGTRKGYVIKGASPASEDIFRYRVYFKEEYIPKIGDKLIFINAGAYIYHTNLFNFDKPDVEFFD
jgi:ornithine decarboxylase